VILNDIKLARNLTTEQSPLKEPVLNEDGQSVPREIRLEAGAGARCGIVVFVGYPSCSWHDASAYLPPHE
jgi:hypothetical protein